MYHPMNCIDHQFYMKSIFFDLLPMNFDLLMDPIELMLQASLKNFNTQNDKSFYDSISINNMGLIFCCSLYFLFIKY